MPHSARRTDDSTPCTKPSRPHDPRLLREAMRALDLVAREVGRRLGDRFDLDELKAFAHEALTELVAQFDPSRGIEFGAYARLRLRGAMFDGLRKQEGLPRGITSRMRALRAADLFVETHVLDHQANARTSRDARTADEKLAAFLRGITTASALGLVCAGAGDDGEEIAEPTTHRTTDPELCAQRAQLRRLVEHALDAMGGNEAAIVRRHYFEDRDLQDAAADLGLSKSWGSRLHARGIARLGEALRGLDVAGD